MRVLFVEDDAIIASGLCYALGAEGYVVTHCATVAEALVALSGDAFQLAILDVALPDGSGFTLCEKIRQAGDTPIILLTAVDDEGNTVRGFDLGADDYIVKPFRIRELLARMRAVVRRRAGAPGDVLTLGNVEIHTRSASVRQAGREVDLTALEYRLLLIFAAHKGQLLTRGQILENLWDAEGNFVNDNTLTVYIKRLREKLRDDPQSPTLIQTVRGLGYRAGDA